jgi:hypothetical protein
LAVAEKCIYQTAAVYPAAQGDFGSKTILQAFRGDDVMLKQFPLNSIADVPLSQFLKMIGLVKSHSSIPFNTDQILIFLGEGLRVMQSLGVYVNGVQLKNTAVTMDSIPLLDNKVMVIRCGRSNFKVVEIMKEGEAW